MKVKLLALILVMAIIISFTKIPTNASSIDSQKNYKNNNISIKCILRLMSAPQPFELSMRFISIEQ